MSAEPAGAPSAPQDTPHPSALLDDLVHQRARLGILTILAESGRADFPYLKSALSLTDGNLGRHLEVLEGEGLITLIKGYEGKRPRTWAEITRLGIVALAAQMDAMREMVHRFDQRT
ncbi:MAG: transcriptional regulator [Euzebya sp.]